MNKLKYALQNLSTKNSFVQTVLYTKKQDFDSFLNKVLIASRSIVKYLYTKAENHSQNDKHTWLILTIAHTSKIHNQGTTEF